MVKTRAETLWECLEREGVAHIFGYPGGAILPAYDALKHSKIHHVLVRHEQGATHMADGYARASGRVGVTIATSGPGSTNMVTGIATASVLLAVGSVQRGRGFLSAHDESSGRFVVATRLNLGLPVSMLFGGISCTTVVLGCEPPSPGSPARCPCYVSRSCGSPVARPSWPWVWLLQQVTQDSLFNLAAVPVRDLEEPQLQNAEVALQAGCLLGRTALPKQTLPRMGQVRILLARDSGHPVGYEDVDLVR